jgi:hypothetical protein
MLIFFWKLLLKLVYYILIYNYTFNSYIFNDFYYGFSRRTLAQKWRIAGRVPATSQGKPETESGRNGKEGRGSHPKSGQD